MRPLVILLIVYTTLISSYVSGVDVKHHAAYDRVVECISLATHAHRPEEHLSVVTEICDAFKVCVKLFRHIEKSDHFLMHSCFTMHAVLCQ